MTAFLLDDFTDTNGTALTAHTGQIGATWTLPGTENNASLSIITDSRGTASCEAHCSNTSAVGHYLSSGTPPSADYWVRCTIRKKAGMSSGGFGISIRTDATCANCYLANYDPSSGAWNLYKKVSGTFTLIAGPMSYTIASDEIVELYFSAVGTQLTFTANGTSIFSLTDSAVSAAGKVGIRVAGDSTTNGPHYDQIVGDSGSPPLYRSVGNSITVGVKASPQGTSRWPYLLAARFGAGDYTRAQSSTQLIDMLSGDRYVGNNQVFGLPTSTSDVWCFMPADNDVRYFGTDATAIDNFKLMLRAAAVWASRAASDVYDAANGIWTYTGSWSAVTANRLNGKYTTTNGDKVSGSVSGTAITVCYMSRFGLGDGAASITVKIDGNTVGTLDATAGSTSGFTNGGAGAARYVPMAQRFGGLSSGAHTVEISHTGTGGKIAQFLFAIGNNGSARGRICIANPMKVANWAGISSPYNAGSDTAMNNYSDAIAAIVSELIADGYAATQIDTNYWFDSNNDLDADGAHPNNSGYLHIADAFCQYLMKPAQSVLHAVNRASTY